ncbi:sororin [Discoglossus pictus]
MSSRKKSGSGTERTSQKEEDIISPPNRRSQRKSVLENTASDSPVCPKATTPIPEQKKRGSCAERRSQKDSAETSITSPPNRRSQRKSTLENSAADTSGCAMAVVPEQNKQESSAERRSQKETKFVSPPNRKSQRKSDTENVVFDSPIPAPVVKRSIAAKKIIPRKTLAVSSVAAPQSTPKPASTTAASQSTSGVLNATPAPRRSSRVSPKIQKENHIPDHAQRLSKDVKEQPLTSMLDILSPIPINVPSSPVLDDRHRVMSQKVRRSYSRLEMSLNGSSFMYSPTKKNESSDTSTPNLSAKGNRRSLFGFDKLLITDAQEEETNKIKKDAAERRKRAANESLTGTLLPEEPAKNIPGIAVKEKRRKRKVQTIEKSDLDEWAAVLNAEFEEAEKFNLFVE